MEIGIQVAEALLAGAVASLLFWALFGWAGWQKWLAVALPYALLVYIVLFGVVKAG